MASFNPIDIAEFNRRMGICAYDALHGKGAVASVIALRDIAAVESVQAMTYDYLTRLLSNVTLAGDQSVRPYAGCDVQLLRVDPDGLLLPQTFVERPKYRRIVENISDKLEDFCQTRGIAKRTASVIIGRDADGHRCLAHYLPPLIEENGRGLQLLDGTHRCFLARAVGTTIESIVIRGVQAPFPCTPQRWHDLQKVDQKPPLEQRYPGLNPGLFRDVKCIGIDG